MDITVHPSYIKGKVEAPASKSLTQRAIAAGMLAKGTTVIRNPSFCNDSLAAINMAGVLGALITREHGSITLQTGLRPVSPITLHCGESGLALRMFAPIAALLSDHVTLTGEGSLLRRPVNMIVEALSQLGVQAETNGGFLPVTLTGRLRGGMVAIDGSTGSQLLTGLLMALPLTDDKSRSAIKNKNESGSKIESESESVSEIEVRELRSKPYIDLTIQLLSKFGIRVEHTNYKRFIIPGNQSYLGREYIIEGDWSGAAFLLVAGALAGDVTVGNLNVASLQSDRAIMHALRDAGCRLTETAEGVRAERSDLKAFNYDATDSPDLFPPLAALAAGCRGTSRIRGVSRLMHKESDRAGTVTAVLEVLGIRSAIEGDVMLIEGGTVSGSVVSSHNDHRIAMMAAVMATAATGAVTIEGAEAVDKS
ncbi:MAG: 3-phosphoshikimate 1-carboxyvinyltransferase, partial [Bacteroidales bacterium]|nr:3-phosphoshikimate 1-carboxyvinyltransferase [Bacteroidales bacterium]